MDAVPCGKWGSEFLKITRQQYPTTSRHRSLENCLLTKETVMFNWHCNDWGLFEKWAAMKTTMYCKRILAVVLALLIAATAVIS